MKQMAPKFETAPSEERRNLAICYLAKLPRDEIFHFVKAYMPVIRRVEFPPPAPPGEEPY